MKRSLFLAVSAVLALVSCSKEGQQKTSSEGQVTNFREISAPQGFDFKGTKTITVSLLAQSGVPSRSRSLIKVLDMNENIILKYKANLSEGFEIPLEVPVGTQELFYEGVDGSRKSIKISNKHLTLN